MTGYSGCSCRSETSLGEVRDLEWVPCHNNDFDLGFYCHLPSFSSLLLDLWLVGPSPLPPFPRSILNVRAFDVSGSFLFLSPIGFRCFGGGRPARRRRSNVFTPITANRKMKGDKTVNTRHPFSLLCCDLSTQWHRSRFNDWGKVSTDSFFYR